MKTIEKFFNPAGIAVIGVSNSPGNLGRIIVSNLTRWGFNGKITAVGRRACTVDGIKVSAGMNNPADFASCDLAVIITPARTVPGFMSRCGELGIRNIIIETAGFSEFDEEGADLQHEIRDVAEKFGIRFLGPNCVGLIQLSNGNVSVFSYIPTGIPVENNAIIAQSGGVGVSILRSFASSGYGVNWMISIGNKLDLDEVDVARFLFNNKQVDRLVCFLESLPRGRFFCDLVKQSGIPVVVQKVNRTEAASRAAESHTAALANNDKAVSAAFEQAGIIRARDTRDVMLAVKATMLPRPEGRRIALLSRSGGHAVAAADSCSDLGLSLPSFSDRLLEGINTIKPESVIRRSNPLDFGDVFGFSEMEQIVDLVCREEIFDGTILILLYNHSREGTEARRFLARTAEISRKSNKPVSIAAVVEKEEFLDLSRSINWPLFETPEEAVYAMGIALKNRESRLRADGTRVKTAIEYGLQAELTFLKKPGVLSPERSLELIRHAGIPVAGFTKGIDAIPPSFPLVAKYNAESDHVIHKLSAGLLVRDIADIESLKEADSFIRERAASLGLPEGETLVQSQVEGIEIFLGAVRDDSFGPMVLFGCGGSMVEVMDDTVLWPYPFTLEEIKYKLDQTGMPRLAGKELDPEKLAGWLGGLGELLIQLPTIKEIDVNPLMLNGMNSQAVDARVVMISGEKSGLK